MDKNLIVEVKKKKEFSQLPDSIVEKALVNNKNNVKESRAFLRKYFGVFLTNKVLKPKNIQDYDSILKSHISSKKRENSLLWERFYELDNFTKSVIDLGCGLNGFAYPFIVEKYGDISYFGVEASGQLVDLQNKFFKNNNFKNAQVICLDLFEKDKVEKAIKNVESPKLVLLFQTLDALESLEDNYSKKFLINLNNSIESNDLVVISSSLRSISGKNKFQSKRQWLKYFIIENFSFIEEFELFDEIFYIFKKK